ncbi:MAG: hypothetical protein GY832_11350 [Chloroflexi bacterium]|nr:hypothetical protein [Chloroflexota bacterium]
MYQQWLPILSPLTEENRNPRGREILADVFLFGGGLDSLTILELIADGVIAKRPDVIIFSDTRAEPAWTYQWIGYARRLARTLGIEFIETGYSCHPFDNVMTGACHGSPPFWLASGKKRPGRLDRQCTDYFKITPSQKQTKLWLHEQDILTFKIEEWCGPQHFGQWRFSRFPRKLGVQTWIGYTIDETRRLWSEKQIKWQIPYYPLMELGWTRENCADYWRRKDKPVPRRSSCVFCPNRNDDEWWQMIAVEPPAFERACHVDELLRREQGFGRYGPFAKIRSPMYVHSSLRPLREVFR